MAKMTEEQAAQLAELERLRDAPDDEPDDDQGDDDGGIIVLRGSRADTFMESLLGPAKPRKTAPGKATPPKGKDKPADDTDDDTDDTDDGNGDADQKPPAGHRYFR